MRTPTLGTLRPSHLLAPPAVWDVSACPHFAPYYFASCGADRTARMWSTDRTQPLRLFVGKVPC